MLSSRRQKFLVLFRGGPLWLFRRAKKICKRCLDLARDAARFCFPATLAFGFPKGSFSARAPLTQTGCAMGRIILETQGSPIASDSSLMRLSGLNQNNEQPWPVFWSRFSKAHLVGSSLALLNYRKEICIDATYGAKRFKTDPGYNHFTLGVPMFLPGNWTSLLSRWVPTSGATNFAHWLLDALPRLAPLNEFSPDTKILVPETLLPFQIETLKWLGLEGRYRATSEQNLLIENYFFSSPVSMVVCYSPYAVDFLRSHFLPFAEKKSQTPKRFFLRRNGKVRNISNEEEVLRFFLERGWEIVDAAELSLAAQIQYFSQAEAICGIHGAGLTNCVWCRPGCKVIELLAEGYLNGCFEWICGVVKAEHRYKVFPGDEFFNAKVDLNELRRILEASNL